ncbi:ankyrin repeat-containing protein [Stylonychia lemnae]|uniref:Ankyrin repeat-containing protein n=1 Tax=Stylonychia lemnae TaxID=5949 RepID=A0A078A5R3_STYLE|nr:ankyrin repeat-containing protein [Stylonychia lemnae]|eukprot:CDW76885.1 ankyrin repeat-containing protein [Stylonychia lemnae]
MCTIMSGVKRLVVADSTEILNRLKFDMTKQPDLLLKSPPSINTLLTQKMNLQLFKSSNQRTFQGRNSIRKSIRFPDQMLSIRQKLLKEEFDEAKNKNQKQIPKLTDMKTLVSPQNPQRRLQSAKLSVDKNRLLRSQTTNFLIQFTPFDHVIKQPRPEPPGNEEYKIYEKMVNKMFIQTQNSIEPIKVVLATTKEKPLDDIQDYPLDLGNQYQIQDRDLNKPFQQTTRIVNRVRGKFEKQLIKEKTRHRLLFNIKCDDLDVDQGQKSERQLRKDRFAKALKATIKDMKKYNIECGDNICGMLPKVPYEKPETERFLKAVKLDKIHTVWQMLQDDKFLVHQFDHLHQYGLHFAAKRNNPEMIKLLLFNKSDVNAKDINGRTPLFYACMMNHVRATSVLLSNMGNAFSMDREGTKLDEVTSNSEILKMISKGKSFQVIMKFVPHGKRLDKLREMGVENFNKENIHVQKFKGDFQKY